MRKYLLFLLPLMAMLFVSCDKEISFETINMHYDASTPNGVIDAQGGEISVTVSSTHSFKLSSGNSAFSFFKDGVVNFSQDGVAVVDVACPVHVTPNNTGEQRQLVIKAAHLHNPNMSSSLVYIQPAAEANPE